MAAPPAIPYPWNSGKYKLWDQNPPGSDFSVSVSPTGAIGYQYAQWVNSQLAPYSQDWNSGYDAKASDGQYKIDNTNGAKTNNTTTTALWQKLLNHSNANFCNMEYYVPLFVNELQIDLAISGSTAQSRFTRDFYPHNIVMPSFNISGQCYSTAHYGSLIEYIHLAQHSSLTNNNGSPDLIQFSLYGTETTAATGRNTGAKVTFSNHEGKTKTAYNQKIVGPHSQVVCLGYIGGIQRTHQSGQHRPTWQAEFVVFKMIRSPLYTDGDFKEEETGTWLDLLSGTKSQNWLKKYNEKNNVKTIAAVGAGENSAISNLTSSA